MRGSNKVGVSVKGLWTTELTDAKLEPCFTTG
jgi:hypothetical protein